MNGQSPASLTRNGITPLQQMVSSGSGAILTSLFGDIFKIICAAYTLEQAGHSCWIFNLFS